MQHREQYLLDLSGCSTYGAQIPWAKTIQNFICEAAWTSQGATLAQGIARKGVPRIVNGFSYITLPQIRGAMLARDWLTAALGNHLTPP